MVRAAIILVEIKSPCRGSPHQFRGFLVHDGRGSGSDFQRRIEYATAKTEKRFAPRRMIKQKMGSGLA